MKICPNCNSEVEENFDLCWNCQYSFVDNRVLDKSEFNELCPNCSYEVDPSYEFCPNCQQNLTYKLKSKLKSNIYGDKIINCLRCNVPMSFEGNRKFHEGTRIGALGNIFELLVNRESMDLYFCPKCGKVEFFVPIINN